MLRWFSADAAYQAGTGRAGGGPGEFGGDEGASISAIWPLPGDSIATWEHSPRRMQVFGPSGTYIRQVVVALPPDMPLGSYPQITGRLNGGFAGFLAATDQPGPIGEMTRDSLRYIRFDAEGRYVGRIGDLPGYVTFTYMFRTPDGREAPIRGRPPFTPAPMSWAHGSRFFYGAGDRPEIDVFDSTGQLFMRIRTAAQAREVTSGMRDAHREETMARAPDDPAVRRQWERSLDDVPFPAALPVYRRLRVDRTGMLWVQAYPLPGADSVSWSIFDAEGRWISDVFLPAEWEIQDIGADYVLVLWRDEMDVEHVRRHGLRRGG